MKTPLTSSQQVARHALRWLGFLVLLAVIIWLATLDCRAAPPFIPNTYWEVACDSGSMRPTIWDGDTYRVWTPAVRPWVYDREHLLGKIVIRKNTGFSSNTAHRIIALTPLGAVSKGDNNLYPDPGFMAKDGSGYGGEVTVEVHQLHPGKQKRHSWQKD